MSAQVHPQRVAAQEGLWTPSDGAKEAPFERCVRPAVGVELHGGRGGGLDRTAPTALRPARRQRVPRSCSETRARTRRTDRDDPPCGSARASPGLPSAQSERLRLCVSTRSPPPTVQRAAAARTATGIFTGVRSLVEVLLRDVAAQVAPPLNRDAAQRAPQPRAGRSTRCGHRLCEEPVHRVRGRARRRGCGYARRKTVACALSCRRIAPQMQHGDHAWRSEHSAGDDDAAGRPTGVVLEWRAALAAWDGKLALLVWIGEFHHRVRRGS